MNILLMFLMILFVSNISSPVDGEAQTVTVDWNNQRQVIDGFGAYMGHGEMNDALMDSFWSTNTGIGLTLMRSLIPIDPAEWGTNSQDNAQYMLRAQARDPNIKIWSASWTPPAYMKDNNSTVNGGILLPSHYQDFADHLSSYVRTMKHTYGVDIYAISIQNEPDVVAPYQSCIWTGDQLRDFIKSNLIPTFQRDGVMAKIIMPEQKTWNFSLADSTLNDAAAAAGVSIVAGHDYGGMFGGDVYTSYPQAKALGKQLWETEVSDLTFALDTGVANGVGWAKTIHDALTNAEVNAWHWWFLTQQASQHNEGLRYIISGNDSEGYITGTTKRMYTIGNFSKFIRPGYVRIDTTTNPVSGVYTSAYKDPISGKFVLVAINTTSNSQNLTVNLNVGLSSVASYTTSASSFSTTLPAQSVTAFVASSSGFSSLMPGATPSSVSVPAGW